MKNVWSFKKKTVQDALRSKNRKLRNDANGCLGIRLFPCNYSKEHILWETGIIRCQNCIIAA